jgi:hypothetical protein
VKLVATRTVDGASQVLRSEDPKRTFELYASLTVHIAQRYAALPAESPSQRAPQEEPLVSLEAFNSRIDSLLKEEFRVQTVFGLMLSQVRLPTRPYTLRLSSLQAPGRSNVRTA